MLKFTAFFSAMFCMVNSQRPWHAGSSNRLPMVLPQYIDERLAAEQASQVTEAGQAVLPGQAVQPGQAIQPELQPGQTFQSNAGVQPTQTSQPGLTIQSNIGVQPAQACQPGQAIQPVQGVQGLQGATTFAGADTGILNRIGENGMNNVITARPTTTINPADLPVDAHGDVDLVNRIRTWPREKQPFWYLNWQAIQAHRGDVNNTAQVPQVQPNPKSFFAG